MILNILKVEKVKVCLIVIRVVCFRVKNVVLLISWHSAKPFSKVLITMQLHISVRGLLFRQITQPGIVIQK